MAEDLGAETATPAPAGETTAAELVLGSGAGRGDCAVESRGSEGAGAAPKRGSSTSDAGNMLGAPNNGSTEIQEMEGGAGEKLNTPVRKNEPEIGPEIAGDATEIIKKDKELKCGSSTMWAGEKGGAPNNGSPVIQETAGGAGEKLNTLVRENEEEIGREMAEETAETVKQLCEIAGSTYGRRCYSRKEMEELRLVDAEEQRRRWEEVYRGLESVIAREYDGLRASQHQKQKRKKKEATAIIGEVSPDSTPAGLSVQNLSDLVFADALVGQDSGEVIEELCGEYIIDDEGGSSDDEHASIQRPAFLVEGEPNFESGPPLDGLEYLRRVRWEAAQIPKVKVAKLSSSKLHSEQTPYMPNIPEITKCPPNLLPSKHWEAAFLADFSQIRNVFSRLESSLDQSSFPKCSENPYKKPDGTQQPKKAPTMTAMLGMDSVSRAATLRNCVRALGNAGALSRDDCLWLFALCAAVDTPLDAETCAALRCLLRRCSSLLAGKSEPDNEVAMLIILTTIAGKYFRQSEE